MAPHHRVSKSLSTIAGALSLLSPLKETDPHLLENVGIGRDTTCTLSATNQDHSMHISPRKARKNGQTDADVGCDESHQQLLCTSGQARRKLFYVKHLEAAIQHKTVVLPAQNPKIAKNFNCLLYKDLRQLTPPKSPENSTQKRTFV